MGQKIINLIIKALKDGKAAQEIRNAAKTHANQETVKDGTSFPFLREKHLFRSPLRRGGACDAFPNDGS